MTKRNRNIKNISIMLQRGTNIMANQVKTQIQNYFEKMLYENLTFEIPPLSRRAVVFCTGTRIPDPLFPHLVPPVIMVWIFVWKYIFEPFIHILQHFVLQLSRSTNFCFQVQLPFYLNKHKGKKQSSKYEEGILASTRYFTITCQF